MTEARAIVEAKGLVKVLGHGAGEVKALKGVDLTLHSGELTLLMGPSGSGKTTLLSILGCILTQTEGTLSIAGNTTTGLDAEGLAKLRRQNVGFIFQSYNLFPTLTAEENVRLALDVRGLSPAEARDKARAALDQVGLTHRLRAYPRTMSGGEQQRVAVARALAGAPSVILADEPTSALDGENGKAVMALLQRIAKDRSRAVLAVTHDHRTLSYADRIVHIEDGRIVSEEHPREATAAPREGTVPQATHAAPAALATVAAAASTAGATATQLEGGASPKASRPGHRHGRRNRRRY